MDDFSIFGSSFDDSLFDLSKVLKSFWEKNFSLNYEKCHFMAKKGLVLDHVIFKEGIMIDKLNKDLIIKLAPPTCIKEVRSFLGDTGFYYPFIKDFSKLAKPLTNLLTKDVIFHFSKECYEAFTKSKEVLTFVPILYPPI